jgi:molybdenum transport protein
MTAPALFIPDSVLEQYLLEDAPYGDLTTRLLAIEQLPASMVFQARHETVLSSTEEAARLLHKLGCQIETCWASGIAAAPGDIFLGVSGPAGSLHLEWKVPVNRLEAACGIASRTRAIVQAAQAVDPHIAVVATRKVFPGTKAIATKAVLAGGATPHRLGLSDTVLVFEQHLVLLGGLDEFLARVDEYRAKAPEKKIAVEVTNRQSAGHAARARVDIIQVDKMEPPELTATVRDIRDVDAAIRIAAAGGITQENAAAYARTGVDILVTSSMYWGKPADIGVTIDPAR